MLTLPIVLLLPALLMPLLLVAADEPALSVSSDVLPGALMEVAGTKFGNGDTVELTWADAAVSWLPLAQSDQQGNFVLSASVPISVAPGAYKLTARQLHLAGGQVQERRSVSIVVEVRAAPVVVPPVPLVPPTPAPMVDPTAVSTAVPPIAPTVAPTPAPTPAPTSAPTVAPTAPPTAAPIPPPDVAVPPPPGVVGYGAGTTGGTGGVVYSVSTWPELKSALLASGPRIIKLTGSTVIDGLGETIAVANGDLTVDGSSYSASINRLYIVIQASNVILTQLRLRPGDAAPLSVDSDALALNGLQNTVSRIVIDHCSLLWGMDSGSVDILGDVRDFTIQHSILGAGLRLSRHPEGTEANDGHSRGLSVLQLSSANPATRGTFYRNLFYTSKSRNPLFQGADYMDVVNNIIYNYGKQPISGNPRGLNAVRNIVRSGPQTVAPAEVWHSTAYPENPTPYPSSVYVGTATDGYRNTADGFTYAETFASGAQRTSFYPNGATGPANVTAAPPDLTAWLATVGPTMRDSVDATVVLHVATRTSGGYYNGTNFVGPNPTWQ